MCGAVIGRGGAGSFETGEVRKYKVPYLTLHGLIGLVPMECFNFGHNDILIANTLTRLQRGRTKLASDRQYRTNSHM